VLTGPFWLPRTVLIISAEAVSFIYCIMREVFLLRKGRRKGEGGKQTGKLLP